MNADPAGAVHDVLVLDICVTFAGPLFFTACCSSPPQQPQCARWLGSARARARAHYCLQPRAVIGTRPALHIRLASDSASQMNVRASRTISQKMVRVFTRPPWPSSKVVVIYAWRRWSAAQTGDGAEDIMVTVKLQRHQKPVTLPLCRIVAAANGGLDALARWLVAHGHGAQAALLELCAAATATGWHGTWLQALLEARMQKVQH